MNTFIRKLVKELPKVAAKIEKEYKEKYAIDNIQIQLSNHYHLYQIQTTDEIAGFVCEYGDDWDAVLEIFTKQLTSRDKIRQAKIDKACKILEELEATK